MAYFSVVVKYTADHTPSPKVPLTCYIFFTDTALCIFHFDLFSGKIYFFAKLPVIYIFLLLFQCRLKEKKYPQTKKPAPGII